MYELGGATMPQRLFMAGCLALWVAAAWWLLFGGGIEAAGHWFGRDWGPGDPVRRAVLGVALSIYYARILFTDFVFLKRGVSWQEASAIVVWVFCVYVLLASLGGMNPGALETTGGLGVVMFVVGSWVNSYANIKRNAWKKRPANMGRLYAKGLFRYSRHPNYFGDLISFSGLCLISGSWVTAVIPVLMFAGFIFVNIPMLDSHLRLKYGADFDEYASRTRKLIPFVY